MTSILSKAHKPTRSISATRQMMGVSDAKNCLRSGILMGTKLMRAFYEKKHIL